MTGTGHRLSVTIANTRQLAGIALGVAIVLLASPAFAQSPWERAASNLEASFTGPLARSLALVAIVIGGLMFMFGEGGAKRQVSGIVVVAAAGPALIGIGAGTGAGMGALIGVAAQAGDLVESAIKRQAGVKESSALIPGHGGLLDRLDSLVLVGPVVYCYLRLIAF